MTAEPPKPNRYEGLPLSELYEACQVRASTLLGLDRGRDTRERANLAEDTALLLLAVAPVLTKAENGGLPAYAVFQGSDKFLPAFLTAHEVELRQLRHRTLRAASELAYGGQAEKWLRNGTINGKRAYDLAVDSEDGLGLVLGHLEQVYQAPR